MARAVLPGVAHHLTQRGLDRQDLFFDPSDYDVYFAQVRTNAERFGAELLGYCAMTNHVHWIAVPHSVDSLARTFGEAHGRYAAYANAKLGRSGHFWQNRFFSCALDRAHLWTALRYVERNPVRARRVDSASAYHWSSAAAHCGLEPAPEWVARSPFESTFTPEQWNVYLNSDTIGEAENLLRINTYTGRPCGSPDFVEWAESSVGRKLAPQPGGRPRKELAASALAAQGSLFE
jgi:putative transposase